MLYSFRCSLCGHVFDESIPIHKYAIVSKGKMKYKCPKCEKLMNPARVLTTNPIIYKGTGFYTTDNSKDKDVKSG